MQSWQIKALELEASALKSLDGIIADYGPYLFFGVVILLMIFGIGVSSGGLRRKLLKGTSLPYVRPVIFIRLPGPPPPPSDDFDPFPPPDHYRHCDCDDEYWD